MTQSERRRLWDLLPPMRQMAQHKRSQNDYHRALNQCDALRHFLNGGDSISTAAEWIEYAEREAGALEQINQGSPLNADER